MQFLFAYKRSILISFFFILCSLFFNITSSSPNNNYAQKKIPPPLILSDYDKGSAFTNIGGLSGGDEEKPGTAFVTITADDNFTKGNSGYSIRLDYDVSNPGEYTFYWIKLGKGIGAKHDVTATLDLTGYNYISFWVKGVQDEGDIKVELHQDSNGDGVFAFGKDISSNVYTNKYLKNGAISKEWQKVVIPLGDFKGISDWSKMHELVLVFENRAGNKKGAIYLDEIIFGYRPEELLTSKEAKEVAPPIESSFKINGASAKECLTFNGRNDLRINAEDMGTNPFLENVRFEYSTDKGNTWRTIGSDYDISKNTYKMSWNVDNSRSLYSYQVRAVASNLAGNENATGVLIECGVKPITDTEFLDLIEEKAFEFFINHQNPKTGLFADTSGGGDASIASTGFGLAALCIGAERGWVGKEEAKNRVMLTLDTFLPKAGAEEAIAEGRYGFFYHFLDMNTAKRAGKSEISTVDTAILICGALTAGEYFGGKVKEKSEEIYKRVRWEKFLCSEKGPWFNSFSMGWSPERGFLESYWDYYTDEAILISLLAIGSPSHPVSPETFYVWTRQKGSYENGKEFIYTWHGSLFSYQYAHAWFDLRNMADRTGVDWFENSTNATLANRQFCIDKSDQHKDFGPNNWGITSMARPEGYTMHFGTPPTGSGEALYDGTISPTGPAGSIVFTPYLSMAALKYMYVSYPRLWGQYGLKDSFNADINWYAPTYYGIGVAMILLPIDNFRYGFIWKNFMKNKFVKNALAKAGFTKIRDRR